MNRSECLRRLADAIQAAMSGQRVKVAIDGIDASGKTTLANALADVLEQSGCTVIRASVDGFHQPQVIRRQRGSLSPEGYFYDAFDYAALKRDLLEPLSTNGSGYYRTQSLDLHSDQPVVGRWQQAAINAVVLVDGVFLQRPELNAYWDLRIWVEIPFAVALERALTRDLAVFGSAKVIRERYMQRYIPGQQLYIRQCQPKLHAQWVMDNSDPLHPILYRNS